MKLSKLIFLLSLSVIVAACGGGGSGSTNTTSSVTLVSLSVTPTNSSVIAGMTQKFTAIGTYSNNTALDVTTSVSWSSSNAQIATVSNAAGSNGIVTAVAAGPVTITAASGSVSASSSLTVTSPVLVSLNVQPALSSILTGSTQQFSATGVFSDSSTQDMTSSVTWLSTAPDVATINTAGLVTAISSSVTSTTMITAKSQNAAGSATLVITGGGSPMAVNVLPVTVNGSLCSSASYLNKPCVSVTICAPGTTNCQTINDILLDTGSFGLRIFKQVLTVPLQQVMVGSQQLAECVQYGSGNTQWGPVQTANVILASEPSVTVPVQVVDQSYATPPSACAGSLAQTSPSNAGFNGILGVGLFQMDCGPACANSANNGVYFSCSGSSSGAACTGSTAPVTRQVQNPVALLPVDNNGVIVELPTVPAGGAPSADGILVLGINTRANNVPPAGLVTLPANANGEIITSFGVGYPAIIDSGSNGLFFPAAGILSNCASSSSWVCPPSITTFSATNEGTTGTPTSLVYFRIENFETLLNPPNEVFSTIGGNSPGLFDWGLPFYFGRNVYVGIGGTTSPLGTGPYFAY